MNHGKNDERIYEGEFAAGNLNGYGMSSYTRDGDRFSPPSLTYYA